MPDPKKTDHTSLIAEADSEIRTFTWPTLLLAGGLAGVNGWLATFAFDVVKTRMQSVEYHPSHPYRNVISTVISSHKEGGWRVFFRGLSPTIFRYKIFQLSSFVRGDRACIP